MRNIAADCLKQTPIEQQQFEIVERKGLGHPDSICDAIMEQISINLSKAYLAKFGSILHHNVDKSLLVAGKVRHAFGGGVVKEPMLLIIGDRATSQTDELKVSVEEVAIRTAKEWFAKKLRFVDPEKHVKYQVELKPGSPELVDIFQRKGRVLGANDTSAAVGYAPMSRTEQVVLKTEKYVNSPAFKDKFPVSGEDVKVMGLRKNSDLNLTISMAFIDRFVENEEEYFRKKEEILEDVKAHIRDKHDFKNVNVNLNTLDMKNRGINGTYLTVLGTSAESGDSGQVGRGNRVNGVISLNRPVCSEAACGKNPVSHVGKIYNLLTHHIADEIFRNVYGVEEVYVWLLSQIGNPIDQPAIAAVQVVMKENNSFKNIRQNIIEEVEEELENIESFCQKLAKGEILFY